MEVDLSVIILSYNTKNLTKKCLNSLLKNISKNKTIKFEVIVVDNGSDDGSVEMLKKIRSRLNRDEIRNKTIFKFIFNDKNLGYPKGNNEALKVANGKYILFLNSDVMVDDVNFEKIIGYLNGDPEVGALTVKVNLADGNIDPASHRGFPTIWNSFCYFTGLERLFKSLAVVNKFFGGYHLLHLNLAAIHEIDSPSGAFYLANKRILDELKGFDENFFMYGEDIDLSFRINSLGYKIIYYPLYRVIHLKHASGLEKKDVSTRNKTKRHFYAAMKIFYKKHYAEKHLWFVNQLVYLAIAIFERLYA